jgi:quercetin dioxygenase-like cupin family protein
MKTFDLAAAPSVPVAVPASGIHAAILLDEGQAKLRRIELDAGGAIPPCRMSDDVVFVVLRGSVVVTAGPEKEQIAAPGAAYIPGGATSRSLRALEPSLILAVLCKGARAYDPPPANA